jgi:U-box domain
MIAAAPFTNTDGEKHNIPPEFICPLTLEIMIHPLMDRNGRSYERSAIIEWISQQKSTCPMTRQPLHVRDLIPNSKLRKEITQWREGCDQDSTSETLGVHDDYIIATEVKRAVHQWAKTYATEIVADNQQRRSYRHRRYCPGMMRFFNREHL